MQDVTGIRRSTNIEHIERLKATKCLNIFFQHFFVSNWENSTTAIDRAAKALLVVCPASSCETSSAGVRFLFIQKYDMSR